MLPPDVLLEKHSAELSELGGPMLEHTQDRLSLVDLECEHLHRAATSSSRSASSSNSDALSRPGRVEHPRVNPRSSRTGVRCSQLTLHTDPP